MGVLEDTGDRGEVLLGERFTIGISGERFWGQTFSGGRELTDVLGGVSGTEAAGDENRVGEAFLGGVSDASGELVDGVEEDMGGV